MASKLYFDLSHINTNRLIKRMLIGAVVGFIIIALLVLPIKNPNLEWGKFWIIRPLVITPLMAAFGSLVFFVKDILQPQNAWKKYLIIGLSIFTFIVTLWIGIILGLDGTLWD